jgi:flagellin-like hook-associated protein FlgL
MPRITPIPTTRVSDSFAQQRLLTQLQYDQTQLLRVQQQISTGQRIGSPSEDAPAALRAISLQRLLEQKAQVKTNLATNQTFLGATDVALNRIAALLNDARGTAQAVSTTVATNEQREAAATEIDRALQQLVDSGNEKFRDRFLFAGSTTSQKPFDFVGPYVRYNGNEQQLQSYSDIDILFETNLPGSAVFGALSEPVRGTTDLNPVLTWDVRLSDLNGGDGLKLDSLQISTGSSSRTVDLSQARTLRDVKEILEANAPLGRSITVGLTDNALTIALDSSGGGNLFINEVAGGKTAAALGLLNNVALGTGPLIGSDLNPSLQPTTKLTELFGRYAQATLTSGGTNDDLRITGKARGAEFNGYSFNFVDDGSVTAGGELVTFDANTRTFTVNIDAGSTTANQVLSALNSDPTFNADFQATLETENQANTGNGVVGLATVGTTTNGSGEEFDITNGLTITNGNQSYTIDFSGTVTIEDLLNRLNNSDANLLATLNAAKNGIDLRSRLSGADFSIGENGGTTASQLGVRTFGTATRLADLNHGNGIHSNPNGFDFQIDRRDGTVMKFDTDNAKTIQDVLDMINNHVNNQDPASRVFARLSAVGNGIELIDNGTSGQLVIQALNNSTVAEELGLLPAGEPRRTVSGAGATLTMTGRDVNPQETNSIFTALIRLRDSLRSNDQIEIARAFGLIEQGSAQVTFSRAEIGARQQGLETLQTRLEDEEIELKDSLSYEINTDLAEAISNLTARQAALQASMQLMAQASRLTLLDYL